MIDQAKDKGIEPESRRPLLASSHITRLSRAFLFALMWTTLGFLLQRNLEERPLSHFEIAAARSMTSPPAEAAAIASREGRPPLFELLCSGFGWAQEKFGAPGLSPRYLSIFFAWLALWPGYKLMRRATPHDTYAFLFSLIFATSPFWVQMGRLACHYSLFALLAVSATHFLFSSFKKPTRRNWAAYTVCATAMLYTGWLAVAVFAAHGLSALLACFSPVRRFTYRHAGGFLASWITAAAFFAPWLMMLGPDWREVVQALRQPDWSLDMLQQAGFSAGYSLYMFEFGDSMAPWNAIRTAFFVLPPLIAGCFGLENILEGKNQSLRRILICGLLGFATSIALLSLAPLPPHIYYSPLLLAFLFPFRCVALAYGFGSMNRTLAIALLIAFMSVNAYCLINYYENREYTNWAYIAATPAVIETIESKASHDSLIIFDTFQLKDIEYHYRGSGKRLRLAEDLKPGDSLSPWIEGRGKVLLIRTAYDRSPNHTVDRVASQLAESFYLSETVSLFKENAVVNEIKSYLYGARINETKLILEIYQRDTKNPRERAREFATAPTIQARGADHG